MGMDGFLSTFEHDPRVEPQVKFEEALVGQCAVPPDESEHSSVPNDPAHPAAGTSGLKEELVRLRLGAARILPVQSSPPAQVGKRMRLNSQVAKDGFTVTSEHEVHAEQFEEALNEERDAFAEEYSSFGTHGNRAQPAVEVAGVELGSARLRLGAARKRSLEFPPPPQDSRGVRLTLGHVYRAPEKIVAANANAPAQVASRMRLVSWDRASEPTSIP